MDIKKSRFNKVWNVICQIRTNGGTFVSTRIVRRKLKLDGSEKSMINHIWRALQQFERDGLLEVEENKNPKIYKILEV